MRSRPRTKSGGVRNWPLKLAALALAVLLWIPIRLETPVRESVAGVRIKVRLEDPRWTLKGEPDPSAVEVRMRGPAGEILSLRRWPPLLEISLHQVGSSDTTVLLDADWVRLPEGSAATAERIDPPAVRLTLREVDSAGAPPPPREVDPAGSPPPLRDAGSSSAPPAPRRPDPSGAPLALRPGDSR